VVARRAAYPGALVVLPALWLAGRAAGDERLAALGLHASEAVAVGLGTTGVLKGIAGRARPFASPHDAGSWKLGRGWRRTEFASFPSGHSAIAFATASSVSGELAGWRPDVRRVVAPVLYAGAAVVAASRVYDDRHWASDVLAGAGIGTVAGRATVRWNQARPGNRWDRWLLAGSLVPAAGGGTRLSVAILPR
jgi:membrane-associated phospholipid phosphatase